MQLLQYAIPIHVQIVQCVPSTLWCLGESCWKVIIRTISRSMSPLICHYLPVVCWRPEYKLACRNGEEDETLPSWRTSLSLVQTSRGRRLKKANPVSITRMRQAANSKSPKRPKSAGGGGHVEVAGTWTLSQLNRRCSTTLQLSRRIVRRRRMKIRTVLTLPHVGHGAKSS